MSKCSGTLLLSDGLRASFFCLCLLLATAGCDDRGTSGRNQPGGGLPTGSNEYGLEITTQDAVRGAVFYAVPRNISSPDVQITWSVNDYEVSDVSGPQFQASDVKKGDTVQAILAGPGFKVASNTIEIKNSPPEITAMSIMPQVFRAGDDVFVDAAGSDPDGDPVTLSYEWTRNGEQVSTTRMLSVPVKRGDKIVVKVTPFDGTDQGKPDVLEQEMLNMPPVIKENTEFSFDGSTYTYQVMATDGDGDQLSFSLESPLPGMTIVAGSGLVTWSVPQDFKGRSSVIAVADDGHGGNARYTINITIQ